ncbi:hypothetical protein BDW59DRAFT_140347 [Aspergillus cavernicola]|uniref:WKF domain-containing protein n=1 Tax=Aspergillus cavernicola TaxID=176166 RepID=A0ABR4ITI2_9EURO
MAEEKKSRSKRPSSKTKCTKDANADVDMRQEGDEAIKKTGKKRKDGVVKTGVEASAGEERKQRRSKKRRIGEDDGENSGLGLSEEKGGAEERKKKKKRISFAVNEKVEDDVNDEDAKVEAQSPKEEEEAEEADDENGAARKEEKKKLKREKRENRNKKKLEDSTSNSNGPTNDNSTADAKDGISPVLAYLDLYHNNRSAWKFQKIRETQLFKHILSLEHIPDRYDAALLSYLQGLKGEAAKQRLREMAQGVLKNDVEETKPEANVDLSEKPSDEQALSPTANYRKAVYAFRTKLAEGELTEDLGEVFEHLEADLKERFRKRRRGEIILFSVDGRVFTMSNLKAPPQKGKNAAQNQPANKKKKNRTAFVDISSSSDSDSDSEAEKKKNTKSQPVNKKKKRSRTATVEISSRSESSSSDSD